MEIITITLGLIIGLVIMYFVLRPKLITTQKEDEYTKEQNKKLHSAHEKQRDNILEEGGNKS